MKPLEFEVEGGGGGGERMILRGTVGDLSSSTDYRGKL